MFQAAFDYCVVKVKTKYVGNFSSIMKIAAIQNNTSVEPADLVQIVGEIVSVPLAISNKRELKGFTQKDIRPGDTCIMSHSVIFDFMQTEPDAEPIFKNCVWYKGQEYFMAHISHIFATVRGGIVRMQNGYVMLENMEKETKIVLPAHIKKSLRAASATVSQIGKNGGAIKRTDVNVGNEVFFKPTLLQLYQIKEKPFGILRQKDLLGITK
jgi:co-chaperonin GroES (HSP10)